MDIPPLSFTGKTRDPRLAGIAISVHASGIVVGEGILATLRNLFK